MCCWKCITPAELGKWQFFFLKCHAESCVGVHPFPHMILSIATFSCAWKSRTPVHWHMFCSQNALLRSHSFISSLYLTLENEKLEIITCTTQYVSKEASFYFLDVFEKFTVQQTSSSEYISVRHMINLRYPQHSSQGPHFEGLKFVDNCYFQQPCLYSV